MSSARRGRPTKITREQLAEATTRVGLADFRLAEVADYLGVTVQTLYNYVEDRDELRHMAAELLEQRMQAPDDSLEWPDLWRLWAHEVRVIYARHPGLAGILMAKPIANAPPLRDQWETVQRVAERYGFAPEVGMWANLSVYEFVTSWAARVDEANSRKSGLQSSTQPSALDKATTMQFRRTVRSAGKKPLDRRFEMTLEALLLGLSALRGKSD
jgi:AcrR family transcriptional regulator